MFAWDPAKARRNLEKHGVSFREACTVFGDPDGLAWLDLKHAAVEIRYKRIARSRSHRLLLVVYTQRVNEHGKEEIRLISARQPSRKERDLYVRRPDRLQ